MKSPINEDPHSSKSLFRLKMQSGETLVVIEQKKHVEKEEAVEVASTNTQDSIQAYRDHNRIDSHRQQRSRFPSCHTLAATNISSIPFSEWFREHSVNYALRYHFAGYSLFAHTDQCLSSKRGVADHLLNERENKGGKSQHNLS